MKVILLISVFLISISMQANPRSQLKFVPPQSSFENFRFTEIGSEENTNLPAMITNAFMARSMEHGDPIFDSPKTFNLTFIVPDDPIQHLHGNISSNETKNDTEENVEIVQNSSNTSNTSNASTPEPSPEQNDLKNELTNQGEESKNPVENKIDSAPLGPIGSVPSEFIARIKRKLEHQADLLRANRDLLTTQGKALDSLKKDQLNAASKISALEKKQKEGQESLKAEIEKLQKENEKIRSILNHKFDDLDSKERAQALKNELNNKHEQESEAKLSDFMAKNAIEMERLHKLRESNTEKLDLISKELRDLDSDSKVKNDRISRSIDKINDRIYSLLGKLNETQDIIAVAQKEITNSKDYMNKKLKDNKEDLEKMLTQTLSAPKPLTDKERILQLEAENTRLKSQPNAIPNPEGYSTPEFASGPTRYKINSKSDGYIIHPSRDVQILDPKKASQTDGQTVSTEFGDIHIPKGVQVQETNNGHFAYLGLDETAVNQIQPHSYYDDDAKPIVAEAEDVNSLSEN